MTDTLTPEQIAELEARSTEAKDRCLTSYAISLADLDALLVAASRVSRFDQIIEHQAGAHLSHIQVATQIRMLMRSSINFEAVCTVARDRIVYLADRCGELQERAEKAEAHLGALCEEVAFWRGDLAARLFFAVGLHKNAVEKGDDAKAIDIAVNSIMPWLASLRSADAEEWHDRCEFCGEFIRPEDERQQSGYEDVGMVHRRCGDPNGPFEVEGLGWQEKAIADAKAIAGERK